MADRKKRAEGPRDRKKTPGSRYEGRTEVVACPRLGRSGHGADCPLCRGSGTIKATP